MLIFVQLQPCCLEGESHDQTIQKLWFNQPELVDEIEPVFGEDEDESHASFYFLPVVRSPKLHKGNRRLFFFPFRTNSLISLPYGSSSKRFASSDSTPNFRQLLLISNPTFPRASHLHWHPRLPCLLPFYSMNLSAPRARLFPWSAC